MLTCKIVPRETYDTFGILLKSDKEASGCLFLEFDKAMQRVSFCVFVRKQCKLKTERQ